MCTRACMCACVHVCSVCWCVQMCAVRMHVCVHAHVVGVLRGDSGGAEGPPISHQLPRGRSQHPVPRPDPETGQGVKRGAEEVTAPRGAPEVSPG